MKVYASDFETTVYEGQTSTEVWSSALALINSKDEAIVLQSITETLAFLRDLYDDIVLYYHNLKFDGSFWIDYLMRKTNMKQAIHYFDEEEKHGEWLDIKDMPKNSFKYIISAMGQWYTITIKLDTGYTITIRDSLKLLPFSLREIGKAFKTEHQKLEMDYQHKEGEPITKEEMDYIKNDVYVLREALEIMFSEGHDKLTIGSCCLEEFKKNKASPWSVISGDGQPPYETFFPNLEELELDYSVYGSENVDRYIRNSYGGGWCYLVPHRANKVIEHGHTADVNSLYPSVMHSMSGSKYPIGEPTFWKGDYIPDEANKDNKFYFIRFKCRFELRNGMLPFVHIRNSPVYDSNENLTTSDIRDRKTGEYISSIRLKNGDVITNVVTMTMTQTDYKLFMEHYLVDEFEILDGCYFKCVSGLFDPYIDKWAEIKMNSEGARRTLAKLFLNNLYGKMASNSDSSFKVAFEDEKGIHFREIPANDKAIGYIPIGSAITSYARNFTIRTAQKNYHGEGQRGFIYADTDSIHCDLDVDEFIDVPVHPTHFCHWKIENTWDKAIFVRQKTYMEHTIEEDLELVERPYYLVKCAGMPKHCKQLFVHSIEQTFNNCPLTKETYDEYNKLTDEGKQFVLQKRDTTDFCLGLTVPEKLMPKRIEGGVLLVNTTFQMR